MAGPVALASHRGGCINLCAEGSLDGLNACAVHPPDCIRELRRKVGAHNEIGEKWW